MDASWVSVGGGEGKRSPHLHLSQAAVGREPPEEFRQKVHRNSSWVKQGSTPPVRASDAIIHLSRVRGWILLHGTSMEDNFDSLPPPSFGPGLESDLKYTLTGISGNFFPKSNYFSYFSTFLVPF